MLRTTSTMHTDMAALSVRGPRRCSYALTAPSLLVTPLSSASLQPLSHGQGGTVRQGPGRRSSSPCHSDHLLFCFSLIISNRDRILLSHDCSQQFVKQVHVLCPRLSGSLFAAKPRLLCLRFWSHRSSAPLCATNLGIGSRSW